MVIMKVVLLGWKEIRSKSQCDKVEKFFERVKIKGDKVMGQMANQVKKAIFWDCDGTLVHDNTSFKCS